MQSFVENNTIYKTVVGSTAYGINTPTSDIDVKGICIAPKEYYFGLKKFEQQENGKDEVIYAINKFFKLAIEANPNIIEMLYTDNQHILKIDKFGQRLRDNRDIFLSSKARYSFAGYAFAQLHRIKGHYKWIMFKAEEPQQKDFFVTKQMRLSDGTVKDYEKFLEHDYDAALKKYNQYLDWKKNRNEKRAVLEDKFGYDCYSEDTEFLTQSGWKFYKDITDKDKLGTIDKTKGILKYQKYNNRFFGKGDYILDVKNQYSHFRVTPNHKFLISKMHRQLSNNFNTKYQEKDANWELKSLNQLKGSHYHIRHVIINNKKEYDISDDYLKLLGLYVSEGSIIFKRGSLKGISLSQLESGKAKNLIESIKEFPIRKYQFFRKNRFENTYNIYDVNLAKTIIRDGGLYCRTKKLPKWINKLSKRQCEILFNAMMLGDGTFKKYSEIYYTSSPKLANDTQLLAFYAGWITKLWSYKTGFQIYVKKQHCGIGQLFIKGKYSHIRKEKYTGNVVCFDVPSGILITRYNGEISIQGNTKHATHLVRLLRMGIEILREGKVEVYRSDREELKQIRNGAWTYEQLIAYADDMEKKLDELYEKSPLPKSPNMKKIDKFLQALTEEFLSESDSRS